MQILFKWSVLDVYIIYPILSEIILINRGWVPKHKKNPTTRSEGQITGPIDIIGITRKHENRPQFMPKLKEGNLFLYR